MNIKRKCQYCDRSTPHPGLSVCDIHRDGPVPHSCLTELLSKWEEYQFEPGLHSLGFSEFMDWLKKNH